MSSIGRYKLNRNKNFFEDGICYLSYRHSCSATKLLLHCTFQSLQPLLVFCTRQIFIKVCQLLTDLDSHLKLHSSCRPGDILWSSDGLHPEMSYHLSMYKSPARLLHSVCYQTRPHVPPALLNSAVGSGPLFVK